MKNDAIPDLELVIIGGAPASGKSTVAKALSSLWQAPIIDFGHLRQFHLDREWSNTSQAEEEMSFLHLDYIVRSYVRHDRFPIILNDFTEERLAKLPDVFLGLRFCIVTLFCDDGVLKRNMVDPARDSGFKDIETALIWNAKVRQRDLLPREQKIDTSLLTVPQTLSAVIKICQELALPSEQSSIKLSYLLKGSSDIARTILEALPQWFEITEAREAYIEAAGNLPMVVAETSQGQPIGFLSIKHHTSATAEAYVLGIHPDYHRQGYGRLLFREAEQHLKREGIKYMTVKTLGPDHPDAHYQGTRKFYESIGFVPIEIFPMLWSAENPCLLMLKPVS